jgi:hypothetical protein
VPSLHRNPLPPGSGAAYIGNARSRAANSRKKIAMTIRTAIPALGASAFALTLAACASADAGARAGVMCQGLATGEGLRVASQGAATSGDGGLRVPVRLEDRVGRRVDAVCVFADGKARWAAPLPAGLATR